MTKFCDKHHMPVCPWCYIPPTPSTEELIAEVDRLKKELEQLRKMEGGSIDYKNGLVEGERRAMERVKEAIIKVKAYRKLIGHNSINQLEEELGLGEESTDNNNYTNNTEVKK